MSGRVVRVAEVRVLERLPALTESMRAQLRAVRSDVERRLAALNNAGSADVQRA